MDTSQLYDAGEEKYPHKIHFGCGDTYLEGYLNIDLLGKHVGQASKEALAANKTDIKHYYRHQGQVDAIPERRETIVDEIQDIRTYRTQPGSVDKIVCIQTLEHLSPMDLDNTLARWWSLLKPNAPMIISVPDVETTINMIVEHPEFAIRHLQGSLKNTVSSHLTWFSKKHLIRVLNKAGFVVEEELVNFHFYPALVFRCRKIDGWCAGREYQYLNNLDLERDKTILDLGPGKIPFQHATHWADIVPREELEIPGIQLLDDWVELPFEDNEFDYVYASHVLEHHARPLVALREIQRVGKRGYAEIPSVISDWMFQFGDQHTRWMCHGSPNIFVFVEHDPETHKMFTRPAGRHLFRLCQYPLLLTGEELEFHKMYWSSQPVLNIPGWWGDGERISGALFHRNGDVEWTEWMPPYE